jgi:hypothetical protein
MLDQFESPTQIWTCVNSIDVLLEGCKERLNEKALENFKKIDFIKMIQMNSPLLKDALYDMCKNLVTIFSSSLSILELDLRFIEYQLQSDNVEYELFDLWLYVLRTVEFENYPDLKAMCIDFFVSYFSILTQSGYLMKYSVLVSEILQEYILADMIPSILDQTTRQVAQFNL